MPTKSKKPITKEQALLWAQSAHILYIEALMSQSELTAKELVFHGGTSLRLSWNSARYSEDLNFLLSNEVQSLDAVIAKVMRQLSEAMRTIDPELKVELKDETKDPNRMISQDLVVSHPGILGNVMVKTEFWRTEPAYLEKYPTELRTPLPLLEISARVSTPVPAATLETAYADKLTAFATRPHLKWRDIYDLWWIGTQAQSDLELDAICEQFLHNLSAYTPIQGLPADLALDEFQKHDSVHLVKLANTDLKKWLPVKLWDMHNRTGGVEQMVAYTKFALHSVAEHLRGVQNEENPNLKRVPRG